MPLFPSLKKAKSRFYEFGWADDAEWQRYDADLLASETMGRVWLDVADAVRGTKARMARA